jgi:hypothetical protein
MIRVGATTIRGTVAEGPDEELLGRLAAAARSRQPEGAVLLAELDGEPVAAIGVFDRHAIADPDRSSLALRIRLHLLRLPVRLIAAAGGL